jgi:hypothetical protein
VEFTNNLTSEEQRALPTSDQRDYVKWLLAKQGATDIKLSSSGGETVEGDELVTTEPLPSDLISNIPVDEPIAPAVEASPEEPPAPEEPDLPPSMRGELETPDAQLETTQAEIEPFMRVNEQTIYQNKEEAIKGLAEKDVTIRQLQEDLRIKDREAQLLQSEGNSLRTRLESDPETSETPEAQQVPADAPGTQELYDLWDGDGGPYEMVKRVVDHMLVDAQPAIELGQRLKDIGAEELIERLVAMDASTIMAKYWEDQMYTVIDDAYPHLTGWHVAGSDLNKQYVSTYEVMNDKYRKDMGESLDDISSRSTEATKWVIEQVLDQINNEPGRGPEVKTPPVAYNGNGELEHTTAPGTPSTGSSSATVTMDEAQEIARNAAEIAVEAKRAQADLHGQTHSEAAGSKGRVATEPTMTADRMQQLAKTDPKKWRELRMKDPQFMSATLDLIPQHRE